jgi:DNA-binding transcriptional regulator LsrR (DeoR family)
LTVSKASTLSSTLDVAKAATLKSTLKVSKAATLSSTLAVTGASTMGSTLKVNDTLTVSKASTLSSTLDVAKASTLKSTLKVSKAATLSSTLAVTGASTMGSTLKVNDTLTVSKASTLSSTLAVTGASTLSSTLHVTGDVSFNGGLRVGGNLYANYPDTSIPSSAISGGVLTIQHTSDTGDTNLTTEVTNVKTLQFDKDSGFDVSLQSVGVAKIRMNSTFKYWEVNGVAGLTAEGLDTVNLVSADGITLSANNNTDPKTLTIGYDDADTQNAISSKVDKTSDQSIGGHKTFTNDISFSQDVDISGKLSHAGLAITSGNEIDQIKTISQSLTLTSNTWTNTNISGTNLTSGIYMLSVVVDDNGNGGTHINETYTGTLSWYSGTTNSTNSDEIQLHRSGENPGTGTIYLRTTRTLPTGSLKLEIYSDTNITGYTYVFKFRRFM